VLDKLSPKIVRLESPRKVLSKPRGTCCYAAQLGL
jgi:hypothetical protein